MTKTTGSMTTSRSLSRVAYDAVVVADGGQGVPQLVAVGLAGLFQRLSHDVERVIGLGGELVGFFPVGFFIFLDKGLDLGIVFITEPRGSHDQTVRRLFGDIDHFGEVEPVATDERLTDAHFSGRRDDGPFLV